MVAFSGKNKPASLQEPVWVVSRSCSWFIQEIVHNTFSYVKKFPQALFLSSVSLDACVFFFCQYLTQDVSLFALALSSFELCLGLSMSTVG